MYYKYNSNVSFDICGTYTPVYMVDSYRAGNITDILVVLFNF